MYIPKKILDKEVVSNKYVKILQKDFEEESWKISSFLIYWHNKKKTVGTFVLPLLPNNNLLYIKEFRAWPEKVVISFPVGALDDWITEVENAKKELEEETGYTSDEISFLWKSIIESNFEWEAQFYIARNCYKKWGQKLDNWENIDVYEASIEEFYSMILDWQINFSKAVHCFLLAKEKWFFEK